LTVSKDRCYAAHGGRGAGSTEQGAGSKRRGARRMKQEAGGDRDMEHDLITWQE